MERETMGEGEGPTYWVLQSQNQMAVFGSMVMVTLAHFYILYPDFAQN